jgi:hypothetical protein
VKEENERLKKFLSWEQEEISFQLEQLKQAQHKIERYEKALKEIANGSLDGFISAIAFKNIAKQALKETK